ncbi:MSMEG_6728 family protein [Streptomyces sp. ST2-7A]|uniref:MSMEG_6728 family protein n=1 Tax=Streptomyces sp. ST2-7A TaxID=2907214 RepID=UPI001F259F98|nr:MSMEG_6728 family protein [Streptomyces sp. ST2-7A]MCE7080384.1 MSMEG_6728 family protein [Streptomyces sp. ST2-7A]
MQTFLPVPGFADSAALLDQRRLGKQRVETIQVLRALTVPGYGWRRHPAVRMWRGYEEAVVRYGLEMCRAWVAGGRKDTCALTLTTDLGTARALTEVRDQAGLAEAGELPPWLGEEAFHRAHRSALLRKDPDFYGPLFPGTPDDLPYVWPSSDRDPEA